jgi:hypothetical protein
MYIILAMRFGISAAVLVLCHHSGFYCRSCNCYHVLPAALLTLVIKLNPIAYDMVDLGEEVSQTILFALRSSFSGWRVALVQFKQEVLSILPCLRSTLPFLNIMNLPFPYIRKRHESIQPLPSP